MTYMHIHSNIPATGRLRRAASSLALFIDFVLSCLFKSMNEPSYTAVQRPEYLSVRHLGDVV